MKKFDLKDLRNYTSVSTAPFKIAILDYDDEVVEELEIKAKIFDFADIAAYPDGFHAEIIGEDLKLYRKHGARYVKNRHPDRAATGAVQNFVMTNDKRDARELELKMRHMQKAVDDNIERQQKRLDKMAADEIVLVKKQEEKAKALEKEVEKEEEVIEKPVKKAVEPATEDG